MVKKLSILIPAFNEERTIAALIEKVLELKLINGIIKEVIVIDDCSTDTTSDIIASYINREIICVRHGSNEGKGRAVQSGIKKSTGDFIVILDADLEYDPEEINLLLTPVLKGYADVVYGTRFIGGKPHRILFFWHTIGNKFLTFLSNMFTNLNLSDMEVGLKLFKSDYLKRLDLKEKSFGFEPEVTAKISKIKGIRIYEVGTSYYGRTYSEGKKINWKDGVRALYCIIKYNLFSK